MLERVAGERPFSNEDLIYGMQIEEPKENGMKINPEAMKREEGVGFERFCLVVKEEEK